MTRHLVFACLLGALLAGCSGGEAPESAFKAQTDAVNKAEEANRAIEAAAAAQRQAIDEQGR
jgi:hypothetical protein